VGLYSCVRVTPGFKISLASSLIRCPLYQFDQRTTTGEATATTETVTTWRGHIRRTKTPSSSTPTGSDVEDKEPWEEEEEEPQEEDLRRRT
jgi:hypothetical protein